MCSFVWTGDVGKKKVVFVGWRHSYLRYAERGVGVKSYYKGSYFKAYLGSYFF